MIKVLLPNTELLTTKGWKQVSEVTSSDIIANYSSDNHRIIFDTLVSAGYKECVAEFIGYYKNDKELFSINNLSSVPVITKNRKGMMLSNTEASEIPINKTTNFISGGLSNSTRLIMTDYELSCMMGEETPWNEWINYGTMSFRLADSILSRLDTEEKKAKKVITTRHPDEVQILLSLSGKTSSKKKNKLGHKVEYTESNLISTNGLETKPIMYKGNLFVLETKHMGLLTKINDTIIVM